jgi:AraC-like DNA-binding protein
MEGHYTLFKKRYVESYPSLKIIMDKHHLFSDNARSIIRLKASELNVVDGLFEQMHDQFTSGGPLAEEIIQAYLQLIIIESTRSAEFPLPNNVSDEYRHIHHFFRLLEQEASTINQESPIRIKTVKEFADNLGLSPNYLNALLKKNTGLNVSSHIRNRLLEESKALLVQTNWSLQEIGTSIGFAEQPNFTQFFKKNLGVTPGEFRKNYIIHA